MWAQRRMGRRGLRDELRILMSWVVRGMRSDDAICDAKLSRGGYLSVRDEG